MSDDLPLLQARICYRPNGSIKWSRDVLSLLLSLLSSLGLNYWACIYINVSGRGRINEVASNTQQCVYGGGS